MTSMKKLAMAALLALGLLALFAGPASAMKYSLNIVHPEGGSAKYLNTGGLATDSAGNVYVGGAGKVEKFSPSGTYLTKFTITGFANDVDVDPAGNVWVAAKAGELFKFSSTGTLLKKIAPGESPWALAVDPSGNVYDMGLWGLARYDNSGAMLGFWFGMSFNGHGTDIDVDSTGRVWTASASGNKIYTNEPSTGKPLTEWTLPTVPGGIAGDNAGNVWAVEAGWCRVRKYTPTGVFVEGFGECSGIQTPGKFTYTIMPHERPGIAVGPGGVVWVSNGPEIQKWVP
jgi:streptogramin lyase